jgi:hypothetical protein
MLELEFGLAPAAVDRQPPSQPAWRFAQAAGNGVEIEIVGCDVGESGDRKQGGAPRRKEEGEVAELAAGAVEP